MSPMTELDARLQAAMDSPVARIAESMNLSTIRWKRTLSRPRACYELVGPISERPGHRRRHERLVATLDECFFETLHIESLVKGGSFLLS